MVQHVQTELYFYTKCNLAMEKFKCTVSWAVKPQSGLFLQKVFLENAAPPTDIPHANVC